MMVSCFGCFFARRAETQEQQRLQALKELEDIQGTMPKGLDGSVHPVESQKADVNVPAAKDQTQLKTSSLGDANEADIGKKVMEPKDVFMVLFPLADNEVFVEVKSTAKNMRQLASKPSEEAKSAHQTTLERPLGIMVIAQEEHQQLNSIPSTSSGQVQPATMQCSPAAQPASSSPQPTTTTTPDPTLGTHTAIATDSTVPLSGVAQAATSQGPSSPVKDTSGNPEGSSSEQLLPTSLRGNSGGGALPNALAASLSAWENPMPCQIATAQQLLEPASASASSPASSAKPCSDRPAAAPEDEPCLRASQETPSIRLSPHPAAGSQLTPSSAAAQARCTAFCANGPPEGAWVAAAAGGPAASPGRVLDAASKDAAAVPCKPLQPPSFAGLRPFVTADHRGPAGATDSSTATSVCTGIASETCGSSTVFASACASSIADSSVAATPTSAAGTGTGRPQTQGPAGGKQRASGGSQQPGAVASPAISPAPYLLEALSAAKSRNAQRSQQQQGAYGGIASASPGAAQALTPQGPGGSSTRRPSGTPRLNGGAALMGPTPRRNNFGGSSAGGASRQQLSPLSVGNPGGSAQRGGRVYAPVYGAAGASVGPLVGSRKTPPPMIYSSASTRLALHDVLSRRSTRSKGGAPAGSMGLSVGANQLVDIDFRPRWRY